MVHKLRLRVTWIICDDSLHSFEFSIIESNILITKSNRFSSISCCDLIIVKIAWYMHKSCIIIFLVFINIFSILNELDIRVNVNFRWNVFLQMIFLFDSHQVYWPKQILLLLNSQVQYYKILLKKQFKLKVEILKTNKSLPYRDNVSTVKLFILLKVSLKSSFLKHFCNNAILVLKINCKFWAALRTVIGALEFLMINYIWINYVLKYLNYLSWEIASNDSLIKIFKQSERIFIKHLIPNSFKFSM
jgi:hypothetical protein